MPVLQLTQVTVVRDGATLLADVDWTDEEGQPWVVLGPDGDGRTTLRWVKLGRASGEERGERPVGAGR